MSQLNEQQRILKNLQQLNKVARHQAQKATKPLKKEKQDKAMRSARGFTGRGQQLERPNKNKDVIVELINSDEHTKQLAIRSSSEELPTYTLRVKKDAKGDKRDGPLNLNISSMNQKRYQGSQKSSARARSVQGRVAQVSPPPRGHAKVAMIDGTTGGADQSDVGHSHRSESKAGRKSQRQRDMIKRNATLHQQDRMEQKEQPATNLNPVTLYQLHD